MALSVTAENIEKEKSYFYPAHITDTLQEQNWPVEPLTPYQKAKKSRISIDQDADSEGTRFILFKKTIQFDIDGINGGDSLIQLLSENDGYIELPVHILLSKQEMYPTHASQETDGPMEISITDKKGKRTFLKLSCIPDQLQVIRAELGAIAKISQSKRYSPFGTGISSADDFGMELNLRLGAEIERPFSLQLDLKIDLNAHASWSTRSLGKAKYWEHVISEFFQYGKPVRLRYNHYKRPTNQQIITARDFYDAVTFPPKDHVPSAIQPPDMTCQLLPFQKRTVHWMLRREGFDVRDGEDGIFEHELGISPLHFENVDAEGNPCYVSPLLGVISNDLDALREEFRAYKGGILAEEMGLGKSVELIALISLNKRCIIGEEMMFDHYTEQHVTPSTATLIISPPNILHQWKQELAMHAPHLKVHNYIGIKASGRAKIPVVSDLMGFDIVLTTYDILSSEIHFAQPPPERNMRRKDEQRYKPARSPLVQISWWRVCLDEAQMIESGVSNAACVARVIPRINAWCVTGTPVAKCVSDLFGLLVFLRYEPMCSDKNVWNRLLFYHPASFKALFQRISLRHTKHDVRDEIYLPPQKRVIVTIPFSHVEEENYNDFFEQMINDCEITADGCAALDELPGKRRATTEKMRTWLKRLRQICSHAQAGNAPAGNAKRGRNTDPRTVEDVLEQMIEQHQTQLLSDEKTLFNSIVKNGQILEHYGRLEEALACYLDVLQKLKPVICEARQRLEEEKSQSIGELISPPDQVIADGKGKAREEDGGDKGAGSGLDDEDDADDEWWYYDDRTKLAVMWRRVRDLLAIEHTVLFLLGSIHYQLKARNQHADSSGSKISEYAQKEAEYYEAAKLIRKELLTEAEGKAQRLIDQCKVKAKHQTFVEIPELSLPEVRGSIETRTVSGELQSILEELNVQANHLDEWREIMIQILISPLVDQDEDATGEEFGESINKQSEGFAYMEALKAAVADRDFALTGQTNILIEEDLKRQLARDEPHIALLRSLILQQNSFKPSAQESMRAMLARLRALISTLKIEGSTGNHRAGMERELAEDVFKKAQALFNQHSTTNIKLKREIELYRQTINARVDFYRQLQIVSDSVVPFDPNLEKGIDLESIIRMKRDQDTLAAKIADAVAKKNYLSYLKTSNDDEGCICTICQSTFHLGTFTICGHQYCAECMSLWYKQHRCCPMCKKPLKAADMYPITYQPQIMRMEEEKHNSTCVVTKADASVHAIYSEIQDHMLKQIREQKLKSRFGSKIDMICKHLLWLKTHEPEAKSVVFSQWTDVLYVFEQAFGANGIKTEKLEKDGVTRFKNDPNVKCFLLHAKSQSSGLTLVNAKYVFICEPLLNAGLELQAISRVHRIGQTKPTTVWLYVIGGTVEQSVLNLATKRRLELAGAKTLAQDMPIHALTEMELDEVNSEELKQSQMLVERGPGGGEVVVDTDLLACLIGSARDKLKEQRAGVEVRRQLMAEAAERRIAQNVVVAGSSRLNGI